MAFIKLQFRPGLNRDQTNYTNEGGWFACDKIRFRSGYPQKLGGWLATTFNTFIGVCRQMFGWITSFSDNLLAMGTSKKVYIEVGGSYYDITPLRDTNPTFITPVTDNCLETTSGSNVITVNITGSNAVVGNYVDLSGVTTFAGIPAAEFNTTHEIKTVVGANEFTIQVTTQANATVAAGGGTGITADFEINTGYDITTYGYGWGAGAWNSGVWGNTSGGTPITLQQQDWWFDQFENDLIMNVRNGAIYIWERGGSGTTISTALGTRAVTLASLSALPTYVPVKAMQILVSQNDGHLISFGSIPYGSTDPDDFDPLLIRWATQGDPTNWEISAITSAGFLRVSRGSQIVRALATRQEVLVWTESSLYSLQFLGTTDVFGLQEYADNISIIGPRAVATANNVTYWMGQDKFYFYDGRVQTLPCTLRNYVFLNLNYAQVDQIIAGTNEGYNEIWWFYPSGNATTVDSYVVYNYLERIWYYGSLARTAWLDNALRQYPQAVGYENLLFDHERTVNANGAPLEAYIQSSDIDLDEGDRFVLTKRILPDLNFEGSDAADPEVTFAIRSRNFPGSAFNSPDDFEPVIESTADQYTEQIFLRVRARQIALKVSSADLGVQWQLGSPRVDGRTDGQR
jgi:hypothetical protein